MFIPATASPSPRPAIQLYRNIMAALGIEVVEIELHGAPFLDADHLRNAWLEKPARGLLFASPANPDRRGRAGAGTGAAGAHGVRTRRRRYLGRYPYHLVFLQRAGRDGAVVRQ